MDVAPEHVVDLMYRILMEHPEAVTLVPTAADQFRAAADPLPFLKTEQE
jgi:hypothetical protein